MRCLTGRHSQGALPTGSVSGQNKPECHTVWDEHLVLDEPFATATFQCCGTLRVTSEESLWAKFFPGYFDRSTGLAQEEERHHGTG